MAQLTPETQRVWPPAHEQLAGWQQLEFLGEQLVTWRLGWCAGQWGMGLEVGMLVGPWAGQAQLGAALWMVPSLLSWSLGD